MARLLSRGLHEPTGFHYLVGEGLLPHDADATSYKWSQEIYLDDQGSPATEEVFRADQSVVWSRNGVVKRVFTLDIEGESILHAFPASFPGPTNKSYTTHDFGASSKIFESAMVVILKTQAHIFCLSGAIHVIPLSFEVARALPFSYGCILQPRASLSGTAQSIATTLNSHRKNVTPAPSNSAIPLQKHENAYQENQTPPKRMPTYCVTDLLSEIGLVAASYLRNPRQKAESPLLSSDEALLYMSNDGHLSTDTRGRFCIAVTLNRSTSSVTVWQVECSTKQVGSHKEKLDSSTYRKRQSSNIHERPRIPSVRGPAETSRDDQGGLMQSFVEPEPKTHQSRLSHIEHLAAELSHDFESTGTQTRSARRISSMLARSDLAPANERPVFSENPLHSQKSLSRSIRKEGSLGSFTERNSFGGRRSFPATGSIYSNATSFLEPDTRLSTGEVIGVPGSDDTDFDHLTNRLQRDVVFIKVKSFLCHESSINGSLDNLKVVVIPHPKSVNTENPLSEQVSICIHEVQPQLMTVVTVAAKPSSETFQQHWGLGKFELKAIQTRKGTSIADACVVKDGSITRLMTLSRTSQGDDVLHLEAPWSPSFRIDLPKQFRIHRLEDSSSRSTTPRKYNVGLHRIVEGHDVRIIRFLSTFNNDSPTIVDNSGRYHELQVVMEPTQPLARRVFEICNFVLPAQLQDSLLVAYWEVTRWLETQPSTNADGFTAIAVVLFTMAVPFISALQNKPTTPVRKKKSTMHRSSSGQAIESNIWASMQSAERARSSPSWLRDASWSWLGAESHLVPNPKIQPKSLFSDPINLNQALPKNTWLIQCTDLTRDFLQSPAGEHMNGPEGYLPTAIIQDRTTRRTALASVVVALHLLGEELRLAAFSESSITNDETMLDIMITQLTTWLGWSEWKDFHEARTMDLDPRDIGWMLEKSVIDNPSMPLQPFEPISVFEAIESGLQFRQSAYHTLIDLVHGAGRTRPSHSLVGESARLLPLTHIVLALVNSTNAKPASVGLDTKLIYDNYKALPDIVGRILQRTAHHFIDDPSSDYSNRIDSQGKKSLRKSTSTRHTAPISHIALRDIHVMCGQALDAENLGRWDVSSELDRQAVTKLIFSQDRRFLEASRLVNQSRPPEIEYDPQPNWTEADALEAQKLLAQHATRRTFAVVAGRGLMHYNARTPLLTEMIPRAQFSMQCILRPKSGDEAALPMTFSADRTLFTEDKVSWAFFHNGASAGLMISKAADFIDTSWILYNKPPELTNRHAGFLLALGLNGHLKTLAKWVAFKYLTPKHTMTSVGLLLGLAASYRGTADTLITRLLSVHVTCLLPPGAAELNLSSLTQTTGLLGIGLLYHDSQHRRMSEVMISEIETQEPEDRSHDEPILRDEGYRLAAGMALGLINLGHGLRLHGLHDTRVIERLLSIAVGTKNVNLVHVLDRATAGAVIALAFIFMKTNDVSTARKVDIPDTLHQFDYVRPDIFLLRTLARHLIMWDHMQPSKTFVRHSLPEQYRHRANFKSVKRLITNDLPFFHIIAGICFALALRYAGSQRHDARDLLLSYLDEFLRVSRLPALNYDAKVALSGIRNCLDVVALSCATVMAGSGDLDVYRRLRSLHGRTDKDTPFGSHLAAHMAIGALFLSGGLATFGTSDLAVASLVMAFYPLFPNDVLDNRGHLQALRHLWVLAAEQRCLILRDRNTGQVLGGVTVEITLKDGSTHSLRTPGLLPEFDEIKTITVQSESYWPCKLDLDEYITANSKTTPESMKTLRDAYKNSHTGVSINLNPRALFHKPDSDYFDSEVQALGRSRGIPNPHMSTHPANISFMTVPISSQAQTSVDWLFGLSSFQGLDHAEQALVLTGTFINQEYEGKLGSKSLPSLPIDIRLELETGTLGPEKLNGNMQKSMKSDKLWQIRLLLAWADRVEQEDRKGVIHSNSDNGERAYGEPKDQTWLRHEVIENVRWRVWKMCSGELKSTGHKDE